MKNQKWTVEQLKEAVKTSTTYTDVFKKIGYDQIGCGTRKLVVSYVEELNLDTSHIKLWSSLKYAPSPRYKLEELLSENSPYRGGGRNLKMRLFSAKLLENKCKFCGIKNWRNEPITLQLDHINGNNKDNRLENLRILCPNCHSQTDTYTGRNGRHNGTSKRPKCKCGKSLAYGAKMCRPCFLSSGTRQIRNWPPDKQLFGEVEKHGLRYIAEKYKANRKDLVKRLKVREFDVKPFLNT
jgi:hypothetical protein